MDKIREIVDKLEQENACSAERIIECDWELNHEDWDKERKLASVKESLEFDMNVLQEQYDFNQNIIDILERIDEGKIEAFAGDIIESWVVNSNDETIDKIAQEIAKSLTNYLGGGE